MADADKKLARDIAAAEEQHAADVRDAKAAREKLSSATDTLRFDLTTLETNFNNADARLTQGLANAKKHANGEARAYLLSWGHSQGPLGSRWANKNVPSQLRLRCLQWFRAILSDRILYGVDSA